MKSKFAMITAAAELTVERVKVGAVQPQQFHDELKRTASVMLDLATEANNDNSPSTGAFKKSVMQPAVPIQESVTDDYLICLEDGRKMQMLKRHLWSQYGLTPAEYRAKWGLPSDYPMIARNLAAKKRAMARLSGLGKHRRG